MFRCIRKAVMSLGFIAASLGVMSPASATLVVGRFDANFGPPLNGVDYGGTATFSIAQSCLNLNLPAGGAFIFAGYDCDAGGPGTNAGMALLGADIDFSGAQTGTVDFAATANAILGMYVQNNLVIGVQSIVIGPATSTLPGNPQFDIVFGLLHPPAVTPGENHFPGQDGNGDLDDLPAADFQTTSLFLVSGGCTPGALLNACVQSNPASVAYVPEPGVPEPGSLALVLGALGVAGLAARKRRGVSAR
jgi:hypothetical protein